MVIDEMEFASKYGKAIKVGTDAAIYEPGNQDVELGIGDTYVVLDAETARALAWAIHKAAASLGWTE